MLAVIRGKRWKNSSFIASDFFRFLRERRGKIVAETEKGSRKGV